MENNTMKTKTKAHCNDLVINLLLLFKPRFKLMKGKFNTSLAMLEGSSFVVIMGSFNFQFILLKQKIKEQSSKLALNLTIGSSFRYW